MNKFNMFLENIGLRNTATGEKKPLGKMISMVALVVVLILAMFFMNNLIKSKPKKELEDIKFELNGNPTMVLYLNEKYTEPGIIATNEYGNDISENVQIIGSVDTTKEGIYEITYKLTLNKEVLIKTRIITVVNTTETIFILKGSETKTIKLNEVYNDEGYVVVLPGEGSPEKYVTTESDLDVTKKGTYKITYKLEKGNIKQTLTRTIIVE